MTEDCIQVVDFAPMRISGWHAAVWSAVLTSSDAPFTDKFVSKGARRKHTDLRVITSPLLKHVRLFRKQKRRRLNGDDPSLPKVHSTQTIGPVSVTVSLPITVNDVQQAVVNALAGMLPIESKINIFGFWHSVILVGCFYRHENLCWVLLNRFNHRLYITSHFIADSLHLFKELRSVMQMGDKQRGKKWTRQGVNDALCIFSNSDAMQQNQSMKLNALPRGILKYTHTHSAMAESVAFLKGTGKGGKTLERFTRINKPPPGFSALTASLTESTCGWKVFRTTGTHGCKGTSEKRCSCIDYVSSLKQHGFDKLSPAEAAARLITILPSSLDKPACLPVYTHYQPFIDYVKANPAILYFPKGDHCCSVP